MPIVLPLVLGLVLLIQSSSPRVILLILIAIAPNRRSASQVEERQQAAGPHGREAPGGGRVHVKVVEELTGCSSPRAKQEAAVTLWSGACTCSASHSV